MDVTLYAKCSCELCGGHISFPVDLGGTAINCPHCQQTTRLNLVAPPSPLRAGQMTAAEILKSFGPPVRHTRVSLLYQIGLVMVTLVMLVLPLIYLGMIGAAAYGVYYWATHFSGLLAAGTLTRRGAPAAYLGRLLIYFVPLFLGAVFGLFLIKPLFARRVAHAQPLALNPGVEQTLYAFIAKICESVGAPMPTRIDLDCELNAAAGLRRGFRSLFRNDLVLVIGLPLVAGLTLEEFAGVIAHEFGHFTQGFGMRLSYIVRRISGWFARLCFVRDAWDVRLAEMVEESGDGYAMLLGGCVQFGIWCTRLLLMGLMFLGHGVSCFLLRQMEFDADSYEAKVAGSEVAERTIIKFNLLGEALKRTYKEIRSAWNTSRKLPDNFPAFFAFQASLLPQPVRTKIADTVGLSRTGLFGTHPSDGDRIRSVRRAGEPGIFHLDQPASVLFSNFEAVAKQITLQHYNEEQGLNCDASNLRGMEFYTRTPET